MRTPMLAVDFGTSNSAAAVYDGHTLQRIAIEDGAETLPTAVFFPTDGGDMRIGTAAGVALIEGEEGRYMRALKSILGTELFHETRLIGGKRRTLAEIVTRFLVVIKERAEAQTGQVFTHVLSGRPVHFHSADMARDAQAEEDLRGCYLAAGFDEVRFLPEPEAAALANHHLDDTDETGLIVDIGGGTSDFTLYRITQNRIHILASHGIRLGGTDFDQAVSMAHAMPLLGRGGELRRAFGDGLLPVPNAIFNDLSTWPKIPFLYSRDTQRLVEDLVKFAVDPDRLGRLKTVIDDQLGHELAFATERGKIAANAGGQSAEIEMGFIEKDLAARVTPGSLNAALMTFRTRLHEAIYATLLKAGVAPAQINSVVLVGGSSLMKMVSSEAQDICPLARLKQTEAFTAVVDGLALATADAAIASDSNAAAY